MIGKLCIVFGDCGRAIFFFVSYKTQTFWRIWENEECNRFLTPEIRPEKKRKTNKSSGKDKY